MELVERGAWKDGFGREFNICENGMYPCSLEALFCLSPENQNWIQW